VEDLKKKVLMKKVSMKVVWNTGVGDHCTKALSLLDLNKEDIEIAAGSAGGSQLVTLRGDCSLFRLEGMLLLPNANIPNLLSVGKLAEFSENTRPLVFIFDGAGATRFRATKKNMIALKELVQEARLDGRVQGDAQLKKGVYIEDFAMKLGQGSSDSVEEELSNMSTFLCPSHLTGEC